MDEADDRNAPEAGDDDTDVKMEDEDGSGASEPDEECADDDDDDDMSDYTYDDEDACDDYADDAEADSVEVDKSRAEAAPASAAAAGGGGRQTGDGASVDAPSKAKVDISELDVILSRCNHIFPEAIKVEDESFLRLVTHAADDGDDRPAKKLGFSPKMAKASGEKKSGGKRSGKKKEDADPKRKQTSKTSTGKSGVGYETGNANPSSSTDLKEEMYQASKRQRALDDKCCELMNNLNSFLSGYKGDEGFVLLALKMSPGLNRMLFSLFKNDSLLEWGKRRDVYLASLDLVEQLGSSKFLSSFLLHDLLEGDGTQLESGKSNCQILLDSLHQQADVMKRNQEVFLRKNEESNPQGAGPKEKKTAKQGQKLSPEEALARDIIEVCDKINESYQKVLEAIKLGRKVGTISEEIDTSYANELNADDWKAKTPSEKEDIARYNEKMKEHRLKYLSIIEMVKKKKASHHFLHEAGKEQGKAKIPSQAKPPPPRRMLRITSEIAGLSADLPVHWASSIFVCIDEDRPDIMKACIMAPEDTPYENGVFEFDIVLPESYPNDPPKVHLITTGKNQVRFNPNLYQEGKVCLSLLGTWSGPGWIPETSTLLQVIVSIQSLIFVQDPYFNEPGYDSSDPGQQARSKLYDKQVRAATLKVAILGQIKNPPPIFEGCVADHFRLKKRRILKQLSEWEELERAEEKGAEEGGASPSSRAGDPGRNHLVAGGGIRSSPKIVADLCDEIRKFMEAKWPDQTGEG